MISFLYPGVGACDEDALFYHNLAFIFFLLFVTYTSVRMVKQEVVQGLYALIESKKMYVRYISHELRTPLNSAFLGLKLVCDDFEAKKDDRNTENLDTLLAVQSACRTAVEILNDLLCFDKLEGGNLEMHKHDVKVVPFIADCMNMFESQAKEGRVALTLVTCPSSPAMPLLDTDTVLIDKFKMDQVLRNLISNALKFTPRGGSVTVCVSFVPNKIEEVRLMHQKAALAHRLKTPPLVSSWSAFSYLSHQGSNSRSKLLKLKSKIHLLDSTLDDVESGLDKTPPERSHKDIKTIRWERQCSLNSGFYISNESMDGKRNPYLPNGLANYDASLNVSRNSSSFETKSNDDATIRRDSRCDPTTLETPIQGKLRIVVTDTGAGIAHADQSRLFKEIVQFNPEVLQAGAGSGLGLWITSSIVQMHAGTVRVYSAGAGKGSTFTVEIDMQRSVLAVIQPTPRIATTPIIPGPTIPNFESKVHQWENKVRDRERSGSFSDISSVFQGLEDADVITSEPQTKASACVTQMTSARTGWGKISHPPLKKDTKDATSQVQGEGMTRTGVRASNQSTGIDVDVDIEQCYDVLVVDDSSLNRKLLCKVLRNAGYTCEEAEDGLGALERVKTRMARESGENREYDAILMDFVMPNMDGPTATEAIRGLGCCGPIFGVTGNALDSDVKHFKAHGVNAVMTKPFDLLLFKQLMKKSDLSLINHVTRTRIAYS